MFDIQITHHNGAPDPTTYSGLLALAAVGQRMESVMRAFKDFVLRVPQAERAAKGRELIAAMDEAVGRNDTIRVQKCEVGTYVAPDGHAESVLYVQPTPVAAWTTVKFTTRIPQEVLDAV